jgi:hypothetical protein
MIFWFQLFGELTDMISPLQFVAVCCSLLQFIVCIVYVACVALMISRTFVARCSYTRAGTYLRQAEYEQGVAKSEDVGAL